MENFNNEKKSNNTGHDTNTSLTAKKITIANNQNSALQFDFFDNNSHREDFYDTTRLIVILPPKYSRDGSNNPVYNCYVSWYGSDDASTFEQNNVSNLIPQLLNNSELYDKDNEAFRRDQMENVLVGLDLNALQSDANYCKIAMNNLLSEKRIKKEYLQSSLENRRNSGNYVGGLRILPNGRYDKYFDQQLGQYVHNSQECKKARYEYQQKNMSSNNHDNRYGYQQRDTQIYNPATNNQSQYDDGR